MSKVSRPARVPTGDGPAVVTAAGSHLWVTNNGGNTVTRLRPDGTVVATYPVGASPYGIVVAGKEVWVASAGANSVSRVRTE